MTARLVVFDVDGTLVDSQAEILGAMAEGFAAAGLPVPPRAAVLGIVGLSLPVAVARLLAEYAPGAALHTDAIVAAYRAAFLRRARTAPPPLFPGARAALEELAARPGVRLGIATGKSRQGLAALLDAHGLAGFFVTCQVADDHPSKPHPAMLHAALAEAGVAAEAAAMVGDTRFDLDMARAAGVRAVAVHWGYHPPALLAGADAAVDAFAALPAALDRLWDAA